LKHPLIQKRIEYFKSFADDPNEDQALLQTIRVPKNLLFLSDKLPQPNYEKLVKKNHSFTKKAQNDLPEISMRNIVNQNNTIIPYSKSNDNSNASNQKEARNHSVKGNYSSGSNKESNNSNAIDKLEMIPENHKESGRQEREKSPKVIQKELVLNNSPIKRLEYPDDPAASIHNNRKNIAKDVSDLPQIKNLNKR
jgi:hypothetical protein